MEGAALGRGINILVLNEDGSKNDYVFFDTHRSEENSNNCANYLNNIPNKKIVCVAAFDEAQNKITENFYEALKKCGGDSNSKISTYRGGFSFIGRKGDAQGTASYKTINAKESTDDNGLNGWWCSVEEIAHASKIFSK